MYNTLLKEGYKRREDEKEVISYWTTSREREDTSIWKRKN
jgi:hypothetical protein